MNQTTIFDFIYPKYKITKPIRLIETFSGYGSQALALKYLGVEFEHWKTCEWAIKSIQAYKDIHFTNDTKEISMSKDEMIDYLYNKGISSNYNEPMTKNQISRLNEKQLKTIIENIEITHNLVNIQQVKGKDLEIVDTDKYEYILTYSFPCVTKNTLVLSEKGYIPFEKLNIGNKVLTKSNTWQRVVKKFDNGVQDIYMLNAYGTAGIECTKEHKFYAREMYRKGHKYIRCFKEPKMIHAKDLTTKHYLGIPIIKDEIPFYSNDLDFWYMIGYYLGDGWLSSKGNDIILACNDKKLNKLKENLDINKWKYTYNCGKTCYRFRFSNKIIYDFIKKYIDTGSKNKHIPIEILNLPKKQLMSLYKGYLDSDGCIINEKHQFSTTNENMAYSFVSIIHKLFKRPASIYKIKVNPKKEIQGRIVNQKDWYQIRFKLTKNKQDKAFYENDYIWFPFKSLTYLRKDNVYNMEIENDHSYIINGLVSANCQDLSLAGKGKGMADTSTRSGMLWEVERILNELKELNQLPQILLMENVPQVHGSDNVEHFNKWQLALERLGYKSYFQDLIATDYGIPQTRNRCFMISILGDYSYSFPNPIPLKLKLKDLLEKEVDEKYYLSDKMIQYISSNNEKWTGNNNESLINKSYASTINTNEGSRRCDASNYVSSDVGENYNLKIKNATKKGYLEATDGDGINLSNRMEYQRGNVQKDKIQTLTTSGGNDRGVVVNDNNIYDLFFTIFDLCCIIDTKEKDKYERSRELLQILWEEIGKKEIWQEIRRFISIQEKKILQSNLYENELYEDRKSQSKISTSTPNSSEYNESITDREKMFNMWKNWKTRYTPQRWELSEQQFRQFNLFMQELSYETTQEETSMQGMWQTNERFRILQQTLFKIQKIWRSNENKISNGLRIRKLTPREAFRLMGVKDEDYYKVAKNQSDSSLYHLAGDSIVVNVLMSIFNEFIK